MPSKRTRERQLAKLAARRQAQRHATRKRRGRIFGAVVVGLAVVAVSVGVFVIGGGGGKSAASTSATASASPSAAPGTQTGTVAPVSTPPKQVACGAKAPADAGKRKPQFAGPPPTTIDTKATYLATMKTSCGTVVMRLFAKQAPIAVNSFVFLAKQGFYDGLTFHRIVKGFVIQGGDPKGDGSGGPGYQFDIETSKSLTFDSAGLFAYANSGPGTNGSQFFITLSPTPPLNPSSRGSYTIFGKVVNGMDVVRRIGRIPGTPNPGVPGENSVPKKAVFIDSITISKQKK